MSQINILYAQSGGVTPVINATAAAVIETARKMPDRVGRVLAAREGIIGALEERLIDTARLSDAQVAARNHTPGGAIGSCRSELAGSDDGAPEHEGINGVA